MAATRPDPSQPSAPPTGTTSNKAPVWALVGVALAFSSLTGGWSMFGGWVAYFLTNFSVGAAAGWLAVAGMSVLPFALCAIALAQNRKASVPVAWVTPVARTGQVLAVISLVTFTLPLLLAGVPMPGGPYLG